MTKRLVTEKEIKILCLAAFRVANLPVTGIKLAAATKKGALANWELCALTPEPTLEIAEKALEIAIEIQRACDVRDWKASRLSAFD